MGTRGRYFSQGLLAKCANRPCLKPLRYGSSACFKSTWRLAQYVVARSRSSRASKIRRSSSGSCATWRARICPACGRKAGRRLHSKRFNFTELRKSTSGRALPRRGPAPLVPCQPDASKIGCFAVRSAKTGHNRMEFGLLRLQPRSNVGLARLQIPMEIRKWGVYTSYTPYTLPIRYADRKRTGRPAVLHPRPDRRQRRGGRSRGGLPRTRHALLGL